MKRFFGFILALLALFAVFSCKKSEKAGRVVGISKIIAHPALDAVENGIVDEIKEQNLADIVFDFQNANGDSNAAKQIASKFKNEKVDLAVGIATPIAQALVSTLENTPIVFSAVTNPVEAGLVESFEVGDEYVTGVSDMTPIEEQVKMLLKFKEIKTIGNIYSSNEANSITILNVLKETCEKFGIELVESSVTNSSEVKQAIQSIIKRVDAIYIGTDNTVIDAISSVTEVAIKNGIPVLTADPSSAEKVDVLVAYGFNYYSIGRATGKIVADILGGKPVKEIPTAFLTDPSVFDLLINLDVAAKMGLEISEELKTQASILVENGELIKR